jgi:hypothetical protein
MLDLLCDASVLMCLYSGIDDTSYSLPRTAYFDHSPFRRISVDMGWSGEGRNDPYSDLQDDGPGVGDILGKAQNITTYKPFSDEIHLSPDLSNPTTAQEHVIQENTAPPLRTTAVDGTSTNDISAPSAHTPPTLVEPARPDVGDVLKQLQADMEQLREDVLRRTTASVSEPEGDLSTDVELATEESPKAESAEEAGGAPVDRVETSEQLRDDVSQSKVPANNEDEDNALLKRNGVGVGVMGSSHSDSTEEEVEVLEDNAPTEEEGTPLPVSPRIHINSQAAPIIKDSGEGSRRKPDIEEAMKELRGDTEWVRSWREEQLRVLEERENQPELAGDDAEQAIIATGNLAEHSTDSSETADDSSEHVSSIPHVEAATSDMNNQPAGKMYAPEVNLNRSGGGGNPSRSEGVADEGREEVTRSPAETAHVVSLESESGEAVHGSTPQAPQTPPAQVMKSFVNRSTLFATPSSSSSTIYHTPYTSPSALPTSTSPISTPTKRQGGSIEKERVEEDDVFHEALETTRGVIVGYEALRGP